MRNDHLIDASDAVLIVVDVQERLAATMGNETEVVGVISRMVRVAGTLGIPVMYTEQYPRGLGRTIVSLQTVLMTAVGPVEKLTFDCCGEPAFIDALRSFDRHQVILTGMEAHICVTQTALHLLSDGYRVHVVADAVCSAADRDRDIALERLRAAGVEVTTSESAIYEATGAAGTDVFRRVLDIVKEKDAGR